MTTTHTKNIVKHYEEVTKYYQYLWNFGKIHAIHSGFWDLKHLTPSSAWENIRAVLAKTAKISKKDKVLDAGCGVGGSSVWLAKQIGCRVTGINISPIQLDLAKKLAREQGVSEHVEFLERDYCKTGFKKNSFDVVWALASVCHAEDKDEFLKEAFSILKPGGRLLVCDGFLNLERHDFQPPFYYFLKKFEEGLALGPLISLNKFTQMLDNTGFKKINVVNKSREVLPSFIIAFLIGMVAFPLSWALSKFKVVEKTIPAFFFTALLFLPGFLFGFAQYCVITAHKTSTVS